MPWLLWALRFSANPLGPGSGPWDVEAPSAHGLSELRLRQAWTELRDHKTLGRDCLVIIKDGALVFEGYGSGFNMSSTHEGFSMTKTLGALVAGWATKNGLDIDKNVRE